MKFIFIISLFLLSFFAVQAQDSVRYIKSIRTGLPVKIDGNINDEAWKTASKFENFTEFKPTYGKKETEDTKTEIWLLYDDNAIYVAGYCHENSKDSISTELVGRDVIGVNDFAGILFDTYSDKINGVGFYVTVLGEQYDAKYSLNNEDDSWSSVYETATKITDKGWYFEMLIPYSALRFSKNKIQNWGVNVIRKRNKVGKQLSWNPIDPNKFGTMNQAGILTGIENIKSPVRLSFSPYFSTYVNKAPKTNQNKNVSASVNGGMDVKYGLSKAFTLDVTLIPDFGQVQSDNQVLNLSPFEVKFNENRSFFTEGTELFNKGNFFYSRRVGGRPINSYRADSTETLLDNPSETKLVNATKLSGRTAKGLGVGIFNAITKPQYATVLKNSTGQEYKAETSPWTNYNILVLDKTLKNNSSITLVNTNVMRSGATYDANVTAGLFDIYDKKVDWNVWGKAANSRLFGVNQGKDVSGMLYEINLGRFRGPFNFEIHQHAADEKYQQNDMGYFTNNNYINTGFGSWYKFNKPKYFYNNIFIFAGGNYSQLYKPRRFQYAEFFARVNSQLKSLWGVGMRAGFTGNQQDFYEPRIDGRIFKRPGNTRVGFYINSNMAKKYSAQVDVNQQFYKKYNGHLSEIYFSNQYRFNDKLTVAISTLNSHAKKDIGFAFLQNDSIYFGLRKRTTVENNFTVKYNFNTKMGINFRARHYWSKVVYQQYLSLKDDGYLQPSNAANYNAESNVNFFNIDMVYTWQFALGSFINIGWKDAGALYDQRTSAKYYKNLGNTLGAPQENNFSVKVIYYLDYLSLKKK